MKIAERGIDQGEYLYSRTKEVFEFAKKYEYLYTRMTALEEFRNLQERMIDGAFLAYISLELVKNGRFKTNKEASEYVAEKFDMNGESIRQLCSKLGKPEYRKRDFNSEINQFVDEVDRIILKINQITN